MDLKSLAIQKAKSFGIELMPNDCIDILKIVYQGRMENMLPKTIFYKVYDLMGVVTCEPDIEYIWLSVERYLNDF